MLMAFSVRSADPFRHGKAGWAAGSKEVFVGHGLHSGPPAVGTHLPLSPLSEDRQLPRWGVREVNTPKSRS